MSPSQYLLPSVPGLRILNCVTYVNILWTLVLRSEIRSKRLFSGFLFSVLLPAGLNILWTFFIRGIFLFCLSRSVGVVRGRSEEIGDRILSPFPFFFRESALPFLSSFRLSLFFSFFEIFFDPESSSLLRDRIGDRIGTSVKSRKVKAFRPRVLPFFLP